MNEEIHKEFRFFIETEGKNLRDSEIDKISSLSSKLTNSEKYMNLIKNDLEKITNEPNFNLMTDFGVLLKCIINSNKTVDFYKELTCNRLKYLYYSILYAYLRRNKPNLLNNINIGDFRMLYVNAMDLILIPIETVTISKEDCSNCLARSFSFFKWLENKTKI